MEHKLGALSSLVMGDRKDEAKTDKGMLKNSKRETRPESRERSMELLGILLFSLKQAAKTDKKMQETCNEALESERSECLTGSYAGKGKGKYCHLNRLRVVHRVVQVKGKGVIAMMWVEGGVRVVQVRERESCHFIWFRVVYRVVQVKERGILPLI